MPSASPWHNLYSSEAFRKACANVHRFVEEYITEFDLETVDSNQENRYGFIKQIAKESYLGTAENNNEKRAGPNKQAIDESERMKNIRDQLLDVLLAGRDTTALFILDIVCITRSEISSRLSARADHIMLLVSRLLVRHTSVMERLRKEISSVMGTESIPSREQIKKIRYLDSVIKESESQLSVFLVKQVDI